MMALQGWEIAAQIDRKLRDAYVIYDKNGKKNPSLRTNIVYKDDKYSCLIGQTR